VGQTVTPTPSDATVEAARIVHEWVGYWDFDELGDVPKNDMIARIAAHTEAAVKEKDDQLNEYATAMLKAGAMHGDLTARLAAAEEAYRDMRKGESEMRIIASQHKWKQEQAEKERDALKARLAFTEEAFKEKVQDFADEMARHRETGARLAAAEADKDVLAEHVEAALRERDALKAAVEQARNRSNTYGIDF
jgi:hypothetical protein